MAPDACLLEGDLQGGPPWQRTGSPAYAADSEEAKVPMDRGAAAAAVLAAAAAPEAAVAVARKDAHNKTAALAASRPLPVLH